MSRKKRILRKILLTLGIVLAIWVGLWLAIWLPWYLSPGILFGMRPMIIDITELSDETITLELLGQSHSHNFSIMWDGIYDYQYCITDDDVLLLRFRGTRVLPASTRRTVTLQTSSKIRAVRVFDKDWGWTPAHPINTAPPFDELIPYGGDLTIPEDIPWIQGTWGDPSAIGKWLEEEDGGKAPAS